MTKNQIRVGGKYRAKINGTVRVVLVTRIEDVPAFGYIRKAGTRYHVLNTETNRQTTFRSAAKFREEVLR